MKRWLLATSLLVATAAAHAQDLTGYHLTFDQNFGANGISAAPPGAGATWETSVSYGSLATGNNGMVNPTAAGQPGSQYSKSGCALNMAVTPTSSPYLDTSASFTQQYGYFEASIKQAPNDWTAFWMTPTAGSWPPEFDILEGNGADAEFTNHGGDVSTPVNNLDVYNRPDLSTSFHTYGFMWTPTTLTWFLDGQAMYSAPTASNEQQPMMLIMSAYNKGNPDSTAMQVAWVRAYSNDPSVPAVQPAPSGNCPETGGAPSNTSPTAAAAATPPGTPPQVAPMTAATSTGATTPTSPRACGTASYFTVSMDGQQLGGVRSAAGLSAANIPTSYISGGHSVIVQMANADGSPWVSNCQPGPQQATVQVPSAAAPVQVVSMEAPQAAVQSPLAESPAAPEPARPATAQQPEHAMHRHHLHRRSKHEAEARPFIEPIKVADQHHGLQR